MASFTDVTGLAGVASAMAASVLLLPWIKRLSKYRLAMLQAAVFVVVLIPFNGFPISADVRGATGDLSITTLALLWCAALKPWLAATPACAAADSKQRLALTTLAALAAVALYPMALGSGHIDERRKQQTRIQTGRGFVG